jgi:small subunit ribosomal protein S4
MEKQKAKYTYGLLERQFRNLFEKASRKSGVTGTLLLQFLESRLDNTVFRLGLASSRTAARQLVSHKHILVNGVLTNIPSYLLKPGDKISVRGKSQNLELIKLAVGKKSSNTYAWVELNSERLEGVFIDYPERERIPENINEQLIVELYSK